MGSGECFKCSECGKEYGFSTGVGYMFPMVYREVLDSVKEGKYGEEWKDLATKIQYVAVDAERHLYICDKCKSWKAEEGLSLYKPKSIDEIKESNPGRWSIAFDFKNVTCVSPRTLESDYDLVKEYPHICEKCGEKMRLADSEDEENLLCPECGGAPRKDYWKCINWD